MSRSWRVLQDLKRCFERISNRVAIGLTALFILSLSACLSLKRAAAPVVIFDAQVVERTLAAGGQDIGGPALGVEFVAANLSGRPLKSVLFRATIIESSDDAGLDQDFGAAFYKASLLLDGGSCPGAEGVLEPGGEERLFIPLEDAPPDCGPDALEIESLYVESAEYEDWEAFP
ncbi:MAG: hypothetical protein IK015_07285 [Treponema sp.]|nr:hypothetical protein [Treponema sp.]